MKLRNTVRTLAIMFVIFLAQTADAETIKMIFWYPGEAGSTEEAAPFLDAFFDKVSKKLGGTKVEGKYFNTVSAGLKYIKTQRPDVGIISFAALTQNGDKIGKFEAFLATLPLPNGKNTERYSLVGKSGAKSINQYISSEPLSNYFIKQNLFPNISSDATVKESPQILQDLKKIAEGSLAAFAILTPTEAATLKLLQFPWTKNLTFISESSDVPTAKVVTFSTAWRDKEKFKDALMSLSGDTEGKDILDEMRLKGFSADLK